MPPAPCAAVRGRSDRRLPGRATRRCARSTPRIAASPGCSDHAAELRTLGASMRLARSTDAPAAGGAVSDFGALETQARRVRAHAIRMATNGGCFLGASLSCADLLVYLYDRVLRVSPDRLADPDARLSAAVEGPRRAGALRHARRARLLLDRAARATTWPSTTTSTGIPTAPSPASSSIPVRSGICCRSAWGSPSTPSCAAGRRGCS